MMNMRRMMKSPTLRLRDGGSSFGDGVAPAFSLGQMKDTEQNRQAAAGVFARTPEYGSGTGPEAAAPMAAAPPQATAASRAANAISLTNSMAYRPMLPEPQFQAPARIPLPLRDGGMPYRKGYADGGKVVGPGTGISDSVPARYSAGEYVLPEDTAAAIGYDKLDAIKDATHTPAAAQRGLRMANGGAYDALGSPTGATDELPQRAVPPNRPTLQGGATGDFGVSPPVGGSGTSDSLRGNYLSPTSGIFPGSRAVGRGFAEDASEALRQPTLAAKVGMGVRALGKATLAAPLGLAEDILEPAVRALSPVATGAVNAANTAVSGDAKPLIPDQPTPAAPTAQAAAIPAAAPANIPGQDAMMPGQDPARGPTLRGQSGTSVDGAPGVSKFVQNGKTLYSNVTGPDNDKLMSNNPGVSVVPGMSQATIDKTLTNPDGSRWSAGDNATMSANLRDGVDPYRGTSRDSAGGGDLMARIARQGPNHAVTSLLANQQNTTALRGQDLNFDASTFGHKLTAEVSRNRLRYDMGKDQRDFQTGRDDAAFTHSEAADKSWNDHTGSLFRTNVDGKDVPDTQKAAAYTQAVDNTIGLQAKQLMQSADPGDRAKGADLAKRGRAALDAEDRGNMQMLFERQQVHAASSGGINPFRGSGPISQDLRDYKATGKDSTLLQSRTKLAGGQTIPDVNLRYGPSANYLFPNMGAGSTHLLPNKQRGE